MFFCTKGFDYCTKGNESKLKELNQLNELKLNQLNESKLKELKQLKELNELKEERERNIATIISLKQNNKGKFLYFFIKLLQISYFFINFLHFYKISLLFY